jgi:hypothetical protein
LLQTLTVVILLTLSTATVWAHEAGQFEAFEAENITSEKEISYFGMVYAAQWTFYLVSQRETISKYGSIDQWFDNVGRTGFDRDNFEYNVFKHAWAGSYYYLFYRNRGYSQTDAFKWSFFSSLAFEYTIETLTEPPSLQDIYQTPVYGTIVGIALEKMSYALLSSDIWGANVLAFILNPFIILPNSHYEWRAAPVASPEHVGAAVEVYF